MMISLLFSTTIIVTVLSVSTVIGRPAIPQEDRLPLWELGWSGWIHTLRRSLVFIGDCAHPGESAPHDSDGYGPVQILANQHMDVRNNPR
ncbi:hypothetical protein [Kocuria sabuli]|uniref:hypothetical protein n=1 Tax=Kocuria sabuli TaxID=3071448 RepID=UPI0034D78454